MQTRPSEDRSKRGAAQRCSSLRGGGSGRAEARRLAGAARRLAEEIVATLGRSDGWRLQQTQQLLSEALGCPLTANQLAAVVAEVAALAWTEEGGQAVGLPEPLRAVEGLLERPGCPGLEAELEALRGVASQMGVADDSRADLYEDFLAELDPQARSHRSVYLTPAPLVRMLVRSADELLEDHLGVASGLASPEVGLLDPATGTGAFLLEALRTGERRGRRAPPAALWQGYEVQPGAYVAATLRLGRWLGRRAETALSPHRVRLHLSDLLAADSPLAASAGRPWGEPRPTTLVVLGNPPWSDTGRSAPWVDQLLRSGYPRPDGSQDDGFYRRGGEALGSLNTKWLQSRYVKFLRVAQWCVDQVGRGVVALVLSDGIADNLTLSGARESLMGSFESIYLLDLGGSSRKAGGRGRDENVFQIQQGASVLILVKGGAVRGVRTFELRGRRKEKLSWLDSHTVRSIPWRESRPRAPGHSILARSSRHLASYWSAPAVRELFERGSMAVITGRDRLVVGFEERELIGKIGLLRQGRDPALFGLTRSGGFDPEQAIRALTEDVEWERHSVPYRMRPGDHRVLFAAPYLVSRLRASVMDEIRRPGNLALLLPRRRRVFPSAWVTECVASHRVACGYEGSYAFPLYLGAGRRPNLVPEVIADLTTRYGSPPVPEEVFGYIYGLLWDRGFHEKFCDELLQDWPRVSFPSSFQDFTVRARFGWTLVRIHLGWERGSARPWFHGELPVRLPARGKTYEHLSHGRLRLGLGSGYLAPVGREVMAFQVGGYPIVQGWIRRRAGRRLDANDVEELCRLVETLEATRQVERELAGLEALIELPVEGSGNWKDRRIRWESSRRNLSR